MIERLEEGVTVAQPQSKGERPVQFRQANKPIMVEYGDRLFIQQGRLSVVEGT